MVPEPSGQVSPQRTKYADRKIDAHRAGCSGAASRLQKYRSIESKKQGYYELHYLFRTERLYDKKAGYS